MITKKGLTISILNMLKKFIRNNTVSDNDGNIIIECVDINNGVDGVKLYLDDNDYSYTQPGETILIVSGDVPILFEEKNALDMFEGVYKDIAYYVDTKHGIITYKPIKLIGFGNYSMSNSFFNVNLCTKTDIEELAVSMIEKTFKKVTRQLSPSPLSQRKVRTTTHI